MDVGINTDSKEHSQVEETDSSCKDDFVKIVPNARDTDSFCTTECVSGDWSAEVKQENIIKQDCDDVC